MYRLDNLGGVAFRLSGVFSGAYSMAGLAGASLAQSSSELGHVRVDPPGFLDWKSVVSTMVGNEPVRAAVKMKRR